MDDGENASESETTASMEAGDNAQEDGQQVSGKAEDESLAGNHGRSSSSSSSASCSSSAIRASSGSSASCSSRLSHREEPSGGRVSGDTGASFSDRDDAAGFEVFKQSGHAKSTQIAYDGVWRVWCEYLTTLRVQ